MTRTLTAVALLAALGCAARAALDDKIAIIGAGFSGLSTAYHLVEKGYTNIEILEQKDRVGGYVTSVDHEGVSHDMATYAMTSAYWRFQNATEALGVTYCELNVEVVNTSVTPPYSQNFDDFIVEMTRRAAPDASRPMLRLAGQAVKYSVLYSRLFGVDYVDDDLRTDRLFPKTKPSADALAVLSLPMDTFLTKFGLELLRPLMVEATDSQAYGPIATTPALYYLTWFPPTMFRVPEGYIPCGTYNSMQDIADRLAEVLRGKGVTISLNTGVDSVTRKGSVAGVRRTGASADEDFDHVIVTRRLPQTGHRDALVSPVLSQEQTAANTLEELQIFSALLTAPRADAIVSTGFLTVDYDAMVSPQPETDFWGILNAEMRTYPSPNPFLETETTTRVSAIYYYANRANGTRVDKDVDSKITAIQGNLAKWDDATYTAIRNRQFGGYFQRWKSAGVTRGLPWSISEIQGSGSVFYVNAGACGFESVGHVFDCAKHLIDDYFPGTDGEACAVDGTCSA